MIDHWMNVQVRIHPTEDASAEEQELVTRQLRQYLGDLDIEAVDLVASPLSPPNSKAAEPFTWGILALTLAASGGALPALLQALQSWLARDERRSISVELEGDKLTLTGITSDQQQRLLHAWLHRHRKQ